MFNAGQKSWPEVYDRVFPVLRYMISSTIKRIVSTFLSFGNLYLSDILYPIHDIFYAASSFIAYLALFSLLFCSSFLYSRNAPWSSSVERLPVIFDTQPKSHDDSTPDKSSNNSKNTFGTKSTMWQTHKVRRRFFPTSYQPKNALNSI